MAPVVIELTRYYQNSHAGLGATDVNEFRSHYQINGILPLLARESKALKR